jgi:hypothetical protein
MFPIVRKPNALSDIAQCKVENLELHRSFCKEMVLPTSNAGRRLLTMKKWIFGGLAYFIGLSSCMAAGEPWSSPHGTYTPSHLWSVPQHALNPYGDGLPQPLEPNQRFSTPLHAHESKSDPKGRSRERAYTPAPSKNGSDSENVTPSCNRTDSEQ